MTALLKTPTGSPAERFTSLDPDAFPAVSGRDEAWRFSPLARLRPLIEGAPSGACLEWNVELPAGVELVELASDDPSFGELPAPVDRLSALALARSGGALALRIAKGAELDEPVIVRLRGTGTSDAVWSHVVVDIGDHAQATVVLAYEGSAHYAAETSVLVRDGARLSLVQVHEWADDTLHTDHVGARVGRDAAYRYTSISLGGGVVRTSPTVAFTGPGGRAELLGVAFAGEHQHFESRLYIDHSAPQCTSDVLYKNALRGESARTVWVGDVRIRPSAVGTRTYELNRNLLLSDGARADSVPNLEIETGDIAGAGHASATGRFDDLQLFYLQSRGIPEDEARRLVVRGFFADVVERIGLPELEARIMTAIEARLGFAAEDTDLETE
ncbi:Fe-S cluster assembly protein SufD [uncultured Jatrophihabitans sp.]|uniref:Fe-S cluster assembly protein SufD n=1 Tax=uncultured Jatrophihabitans sp. TaxID=1610747 RepID=UPI0035CC2C4C